MHDHKVTEAELVGDTRRFTCRCGWMMDVMIRHGKQHKVLICAGSEPEAHKQDMEEKHYVPVVLPSL